MVAGETGSPGSIRSVTELKFQGIPQSNKAEHLGAPPVSIVRPC